MGAVRGSLKLSARVTRTQDRPRLTGVGLSHNPDSLSKHFLDAVLLQRPSTR